MRNEIREHPLAAQFNRLTPEEVLGAVEASGRRASGRFIVLNSYENRVYQLELEDETWVVGKFYRPGRWSEAAIRDEHDFLAELAAEEVPVAEPLELETGRTIGEVQGIRYALFPRIGGRAPQELDREQIDILGRLLARIHNVGARRRAEARLAIDPETYGTRNLEFLVASGAVPAEARAQFEDTARRLVDRIAPLFQDVPVHRIHGDCHLGNLLFAPRGPTFLDFDDMATGPAVQDVWMLAPSADAYGRAERERLVAAYSGLRDFHPIWLRLVEPLRALRFIHYVTWIARRFDDPVFPRTFPHFGTLQFWQKETADLREQIARIDEESYRYMV